MHFIIPKPKTSAKDLESFYTKSESSKYWAQDFYPAVAETRRLSIFRPRVFDIVAMCKMKSVNVGNLIDVGSGYGIFLEEWRAHNAETTLLAIEPNESLAEVCSL